MPDTRGIAGFGAGFSQTSNARSNRMQVELMEKKNQQDQAQQFRERIDTGIANSMALLQQAAKANSASAFSAADPGGKQKAVEVQTRTAQGLWKSTQQALEMGKQQGLYTDQEIATIKQQFRTAATLRDPVAEKKLEEQVATQGKIDTAEGLLSSKKEFDEFQTDQDIRLKGSPSAPETLITGTPADFLTKQQKSTFAANRIEAETTLKQNVFAMDELIKIVESPDFIGGNTGDLVSSVNSLVAQVRAVTGTKPVIESDAFQKGRNLDLDQVGEDVSDKNLNLLRKWAISDDLEESASLNMAFILAKSLNQGGKISDADVENAQKIIGRSSDPASRRVVLRSLQERMIRNYNIEQEILSRNLPGLPFEPLTLDKIRGFEGASVGSTQDGMDELKRLEEENKKLEEELRVGQ